MTAPNIVDVTTIIGKTETVALSTTGETVLVSNAAASNKVFKINMIQIANVDGLAACDATVKVHSAAAGGGTGFSLVSTVSVATGSTLIALDKTTSLYLEEDKSITVTASTADDLEVIVSYEEIS